MSTVTRRRLIVLIGFLVVALLLYWAADSDATIAEIGLFAVLGGLALAAIRWG